MCVTNVSCDVDGSGGYRWMNKRRRDIEEEEKSKENKPVVENSEGERIKLSISFHVLKILLLSH